MRRELEISKEKEATRRAHAEEAIQQSQQLHQAPTQDVYPSRQQSFQDNTSKQRQRGLPTLAAGSAKQPLSLSTIQKGATTTQISSRFNLSPLLARSRIRATSTSSTSSRDTIARFPNAAINESTLPVQARIRATPTSSTSSRNATTRFSNAAINSSSKRKFVEHVEVQSNSQQERAVRSRSALVVDTQDTLKGPSLHSSQPPGIQSSPRQISVVLEEGDTQRALSPQRYDSEEEDAPLSPTRRASSPQPHDSEEQNSTTAAEHIHVS